MLASDPLLEAVLAVMVEVLILAGVGVTGLVLHCVIRLTARRSSALESSLVPLRVEGVEMFVRGVLVASLRMVDGVRGEGLGWGGVQGSTLGLDMISRLEGKERRRGGW